LALPRFVENAVFSRYIEIFLFDENPVNPVKKKISHPPSFSRFWEINFAHPPKFLWIGATVKDAPSVVLSE